MYDNSQVNYEQNYAEQEDSRSVCTAQHVVYISRCNLEISSINK